MIANYHTHTWRCNHATGMEVEYVESAIQRGIKILGFSDHTPYLFPNGYRSRIRMLPEQLDDYCRTLEQLRQKYQSEIEIHIGVEAEYYPAYFSDTLSFLKDHGIEYMILGQHFMDNEPGWYSGAETVDLDRLKSYCKQTMDAIQTGCYTYFAHPDLINYIGEERNYQQYMSEVVRELVSCGIPAEINLLGLKEERHYPREKFLEILALENCPVILGCDAHDPETLAETQWEEKAMVLCNRYQLNVLDKAIIRKL